MAQVRTHSTAWLAHHSGKGCRVCTHCFSQQHSPPVCAGAAGATSKAIERKSTWMTTRLSGAASLVALSAGLVVLASSLGLNLPLPQLLGLH